MIFPALVILLAGPLYALLKRRAVRIRAELESDGDEESRLAELTEKRRRLEKDCSEEQRKAAASIKKYSRIKKSIRK